MERLKAEDHKSNFDKMNENPEELTLCGLDAATGQKPFAVAAPSLLHLTGRSDIPCYLQLKSCTNAPFNFVK